MHAVLVWNGRVANPAPSQRGAITEASSAAIEATESTTGSTSDTQGAAHRVPVGVRSPYRLRPARIWLYSEWARLDSNQGPRDYESEKTNHSKPQLAAFTCVHAGSGRGRGASCPPGTSLAVDYVTRRR
jgi:hypothetical protein